MHQDVSGRQHAHDVDPASITGSVDAPKQERHPVLCSTLAWSSVLLGLMLFFCFGWGPLVLHESGWATSRDLWDVFRASQYVGWGDIGGVSSPSLAIMTLPGFFVLFAPFALLVGALHLTASSPGIVLAHPGADFVLVPAEALFAVPLLAVVAQWLHAQGMPRLRRRIVMAAVVLLSVAVCGIWGHAEDLVATAAGLGALQLVDKGRVRGAGWVLGLGVVVQPLVLALVPLVIASAARRKLATLARAAVPSVLLVGLALLSNRAGTLQALFRQGEAPSVNRATPWVALAPKLALPHRFKTKLVAMGMLHGHFVVHTKVVTRTSLLVVSASPFRDASLLAAVGVGVYAWRRRPDAHGLLWLGAVALALRCFVEPVMIPYFLTPAIVVAVMASAAAGRRRLTVCLVVATGDSVLAYYHLSPWAWFLPVVAMLTVVLACGYPGRAHLAPSRGPADEDDTTGADGGRGVAVHGSDEDIERGGWAVVTPDQGHDAGTEREAGGLERDRRPVPAMARASLGTRGAGERIVLEGGMRAELAGVGSLSEAWRRAALVAPAGPVPLPTRLARRGADVLRWALGARRSQRPDRVLAAGELLA